MHVGTALSTLLAPRRAALWSLAAPLVLAAGAAAQVPLLIEGTLVSPLGGPSVPTTSAPMLDCGPQRQRELTPAEAAAEAFRQKRVSGRELEKAVLGVRKALRWYEDLAVASRVASSEGKPIVWIHALGELDGFL
jgi:hypothetical protein